MGITVYAYKKKRRWGVFFHEEAAYQTRTPRSERAGGGSFYARGFRHPDPAGKTPYRSLEELLEDWPTAIHDPQYDNSSASAYGLLKED